MATTEGSLRQEKFSITAVPAALCGGIRKNAEQIKAIRGSTGAGPHVLEYDPRRGADPGDDMDRFIRMDKERLLEQHQQQVAILHTEIEQWRGRTSELGDEIRRRKALIDRLWLTVFGMALVIAYLYVRDIGCK